MIRIGAAAVVRAAVAALLAIAGVAAATAEERQVAYRAEIRLLSGALRFEVAGQLHERLDQVGERYALRLQGAGSGLAILVESHGVLHGDRWTPRQTRTAFTPYGRHYRADIDYDLHARRVVYRSYSETFFLRFPRRTDDVLSQRLRDFRTLQLEHQTDRSPQRRDILHEQHSHVNLA